MSEHIIRKGVAFVRGNLVGDIRLRCSHAPKLVCKGCIIARLRGDGATDEEAGVGLIIELVILGGEKRGAPLPNITRGKNQSASGRKNYSSLWFVELVENRRRGKWPNQNIENVKRMLRISQCHLR